MKGVFLIGAAALALALAGCDAGPSAVQQGAAGRTRRGAGRGAGRGSGPPRAGRRSPRPIRATRRCRWSPTASRCGRPTASTRAAGERRLPVQQERQGLRRARPRRDYVAKVHAFVDAPPTGVQKDRPLQRRCAALRRQEQHLRGGDQGRRAAHHVQAARRRGLLGPAGRPRTRPRDSKAGGRQRELIRRAGAISARRSGGRSPPAGTTAR